MKDYCIKCGNEFEGEGVLCPDCIKVKHEVTIEHLTSLKELENGNLSEESNSTCTSCGGEIEEDNPTDTCDRCLTRELIEDRTREEVREEQQRISMESNNGNNSDVYSSESFYIMDDEANVTLPQPVKSKKPFYKQWYAITGMSILVVGLLAIVVIGSTGEDVNLITPEEAEGIALEAVSDEATSKYVLGTEFNDRRNTYIVKLNCVDVVDMTDDQVIDVTVDAETKEVLESEVDEDTMSYEEAVSYIEEDIKTPEEVVVEPRYSSNTNQLLDATVSSIEMMEDNENIILGGTEVLSGIHCSDLYNPEDNTYSIIYNDGETKVMTVDAETGEVVGQGAFEEVNVYQGEARANASTELGNKTVDVWVNGVYSIEENTWSFTLESDVDGQYYDVVVSANTGEVISSVKLKE